MAFWHIFLGFCLLAAIFVAWPAFFVGKRHKRALLRHSQASHNEEAYQQYLAELGRTHQRGEINHKDYEALKRDLERTLVEDSDGASMGEDKILTTRFKTRLPIFGLLIILPVFVFFAYQHVGAKDDWQIYQMAVKSAKSQGEARANNSKELIQRLQERLAERPENIQNWYLLASTSTDLGQFDEAVRAYREILKRDPNSAEIKAEMAQALFFRAGSTITPEVRQQTKEALDIDPRTPTALGLAGIDAFQSGLYEDAVTFWEQAVAQLDPSSPSAEVLKGGIARAQAAIKKQGGSVKNDSTSTAASASLADQGSNVSDTSSAGGPSLVVKVSLDKEKVTVSPQATVFVYARAWQGPRMPLAIKKLTVADLPATIVLDKSSAMGAGMDLTSFPQVEVLARISLGGSPVPASGDWQAAMGPVQVDTQKDAIPLVISELIP